MALNPAIALAARPVEIADPMAMYGKIAAIQQAQNQNALAQFQLGAAQRTEATQNALSAAYQAAYDPETGKINANKLRQSLATGGYGAQIPTVEKALGELETQALTRQKTEGDLIEQRLKLSKQGLETVHTPEEYLAWHEANHRDPVLRKYFADRGITADSARANIEEKLAQPYGFQQLMRASALGLEKSMEQHFAEQNLGGTKRTLATPKYAVPGAPLAATVVPGSEAKVGMTPYEQGQLAVSQAREQRLAQGPMGVSLSPEQNDALFGENGAVAQGKINPNRINSRNAKMWADAFMRNPNADPVKVAQEVGAADKAIKDFSTGPQGVKVTAFNTAIDHLETLDQLGVALKNGDVQAINSIANTLGVKTGQPAATMFNQASRIVGAEISKAIVPGVGTGKEREETATAFSSAMSPEQLTAASATAKKLLGGQLNSLELQYNRTTKRKDFADQLLTPAARAAYMSSRSTPAAAPATAPAAPAASGNWKDL